MYKYKFSNKQWIKSMVFYFLFFFIGSFIILAFNGWLTISSFLLGISISVLLTLFFVFIMTQINYITALGTDEKNIYIWKRNFFKISEKKYPFLDVKFKYQKNYYGNLGKPYCLILRVKYDKKEIIPEPIVGIEIMAKIINDIENQGIYVEKH